MMGKEDKNVLRNQLNTKNLNTNSSRISKQQYSDLEGSKQKYVDKV